MPRARPGKSPALPLFASASPPAAAREVVVHTDGACSGNPGPGGWAAVVETREGFREMGGREEQTTNNRMEMRGALEALRSVPPGARVHVVTDSRYLLDGICKWIHGWKRRGWRKADGEEVLNRDLWEALDEAARAHGRNLTWEHVRGHSGAPLNERCDAIATAFARGEAPELQAGTGPWGVPPALPGPAPSDLPAFPAYLSLVDGILSAHRTWAECEAVVHGAPGAKHRKVRSAAEYQSALQSWGLARG